MHIGLRWKPLAIALTLGMMPVAASAQDSDAITIVVTEQPDSLDPCMLGRSQSSRIFQQNVIETLTEVDPSTGQVNPRLAVSWERKDDLTWVFHLRENVKYHDGEAFDAKALIYSINRMLNDSIECVARSKFFVGFEIVPTEIDSYTVEIKTSVPKPIFPTLVSTIPIVSPNTPIDAATNDPVGTGPYDFVEWISGERIELVRFPDYWGGTPDVAKATYVWRSESTIRAGMVATGEADVTPVIAAQDATNPETDFPYPNNEVSTLRIDQTFAPLNDVRFRQALNLAIDREALATIFGADVKPAAQLVHPHVVGYNPDLKPWPYDPEKAKELLAAARADGVPVDTEITIISRPDGYPGSTESVEAMMAMWSEVGINTKILSLEVAEWIRYLTKPFPEGRPPNLYQVQFDDNYGDAEFVNYAAYHTNGTYSTFSDPEIDAALEKGISSTGEERAKLFQEVFRRAHEDIVADVFMYQMVGYARVSPRLSWRPNSASNNELQIATIKLNK